MQSFFQRLRWPLLAASVASLAVVATAGATHGTPDYLANGHTTSTPVGDGSSASCNFTGACFSAVNSEGSTAVGLWGDHAATTGNSPGIFGVTRSTWSAATGVEGLVDSASAGIGSAGVKGSNDGDGYGVFGYTLGGSAGVYGTGGAATTIGVWGNHAAASGTAAGVLGETNSTSVNAVGIRGEVNSTTPGLSSAGVRGINNGTGGAGIGVYGSHAGSGWGVYGTSPAGRGVYGSHSGGSGTEGGVVGQTSSATDLAAGLRGTANAAGASVIGVYGTSQSGVGVAGGGGNVGILGYNTSSGPAGVFLGDVAVTGTLTKGAGAFRIDHPLEPRRKYLQHSFVESPDMKNVYDGVIRTDRRGFATARLPRYFQALNRDFRYQLTLLGKAAWGAQAVVWQKIKGNRFVIRSRPRVEVSWQVTGIRKDRYANAHRIQPELAKPASERGTYLAPELYGKPRSQASFRLPNTSD